MASRWYEYFRGSRKRQSTDMINCDRSERPRPAYSHRAAATSHSVSGWSCLFLALLQHDPYLCFSVRASVVPWNAHGEQPSLLVHFMSRSHSPGVHGNEIDGSNAAPETPIACRTRTQVSSWPHGYSAVREWRQDDGGEVGINKVLGVSS
jgi:hypothetical protein